MADKSEKPKETRWFFKDGMVEDLIEVLEATKVEYEGRGLDFEGDLVKLYSELRKLRWPTRDTLQTKKKRCK